MVQPGTNPSPDEPFHRDGSEHPDAGLEGVVEELKNVLAGLNEPEEAVIPEEPAAPPISETSFPFSPTAATAPLEETPAPVQERGPLQDDSPPSDAEFWNGNVLGWSDKAQPAEVMGGEPLAELPPAESPILSEPESESEPQPFAQETPQTQMTPVEDLLPPLPPSPFDLDARPPEPAGAAAAAPAHAPHNEPAVPEPQPTAENFLLSPPSIPPIVIPELTPQAKTEEEDLADDEVVAEKPEGTVQIACIYPKGLEKQGQHFMSTLRGACEKAKVPLTVQAVFIHPWSAGAISIPSWVKSAHKAGAERLFVLTQKKDQEQFKNLAADAASMGLKSRLILIEHVGLRTLYADILVELRRT